MTIKTDNSDPRRGAVLILVMLILAVLLALAAALALTSRVELRISDYYVADQTAEAAMDALEQYSAERLLQDRYNNTGSFRFHDSGDIDRIVLVESGDVDIVSATSNTLTVEDADWDEDIYARAVLRITTGTGAGQVRRILSNDADTLTVVTDWGAVPDAGSEFEMFASKQYLLKRFVAEDVWTGTDETEHLPDVFHISRNREEVPLKARFALHFEDIGGGRLDINMTGNLAGAGGTHDEGWGETTFMTRLAGVTGEDLAGDIIDERGRFETAFYGYDEFAEEFTYNPDYPLDGSPFGAGELIELIWSEIISTDSPKGMVPWLLDSHGVWPEMAPSLTTTSASGIFAGLVADAETEFGTDSGRVLAWLDRDDFPFWKEGFLPFTNGQEDSHLLLKRPLQQILLEFEADPENGVTALRDFLGYINAVGSGFDIDEDYDTNTVLNQVALNIWNLMAYLDEDLDYLPVLADGPELYYGVIPGVPYVAEVMAHRPPFMNEADLEETDDHPGEFDLEELDKAKYIKLVNPWGIDSPDITVAAAGASIPIGVIPPRSHYLIIAAEEINDNGTLIHQNLPAISAEELLFVVEPAVADLAYGDTIQVQVNVNGTAVTVWETAVGEAGTNDIDDSEELSLQIADPRSTGHDWNNTTEWIPEWDPPVWTDIGGEWEWNWTGAGWTWPAVDTDAVDWFNRNWRADEDIGEDDTTGIGSGDNWFKLHAPVGEEPLNPQNLLDSFRLPDSFRSPADLTCVHAGIDWCTLSPTAGGAQNAEHVVFLRGLAQYLIGNSPYEHLEGEPIYEIGAGNEQYDRLGPPVRLHGRVNVNTAPVEVLRALVPHNVLLDIDLWNIGLAAGQIEDVVDDIAEAIVDERETEGAFENLDDFFDRIPQVFGYNPDGWSIGGTDLLGAMPNSPLRHAMSRSLYNRITVRSDVWGVTGRVQLYEEDEITGDIDIVAERAFYTVIDRSFLHPRVLFRTQIQITD